MRYCIHHHSSSKCLGLWHVRSSICRVPVCVHRQRHVEQLFFVFFIIIFFYLRCCYLSNGAIVTRMKINDHIHATDSFYQ